MKIKQASLHTEKPENSLKKPMSYTILA